jgi:Mg-chelatase subunit ChlD
MMFRRPLTPACLAVAMCVCGSTGSAQTGQLAFADRVRLISCLPATTRPVFRAQFNVVDQSGAPLAVSYPPNENLRERLAIFVDDRELQPFYAVAEGDQQASVARRRNTLILVDTSGSMNAPMASGGTRFQAAQAALRDFLTALDEKVDRTAIVPFDSHDVVRRIRAAEFVGTRAQALAQIDTLPPPRPANNTAIYSAVTAGVQLLDEQARAAADTAGGAPETLLILMTDGRNEVGRADDPGLLDGPNGLARAADAIRASGVQVIAIGFGAAGAVDESALRQISARFFPADNPADLRQQFSVARTFLTSRVLAVFASPWDDRASLEGRTLRVRASLTLPDDRRVVSQEQTWLAPQIGVPAFDGRCGTEELRAALLLVPSSGSALSTLRPILVFTGLGSLLLVFWFWVPRLMWPDQYIGSLPGASGDARWASAKAPPDRGGKRSGGRPGRPAPPGFETQGRNVAVPRTPMDHTFVQPRPDGTRTRLQKRPPGER